MGIKCKQCSKRASYGLLWNTPLYCKSHAVDGTKNVISKRCNKCEKHPTFGLINGKVEYCKDHANNDMVDLKNFKKQCKSKDCNTRAIFGLKGSKAVACKLHSTDLMIDVVNKPCNYKDCTISPIFGPTNGKAIYCKKHAIDGMIDLKHKKYCKSIGCNIRPVFGINLGDAIYCKTHSTNEMQDVINKLCVYQGCLIKPTFGLIVGKPTYCREHASNNMIDCSHKYCEYDGCTIRPSFGLYLKIATHCKIHAADNMINILVIRCTLCDSTKMNKKYNPYCARCHFYLYPEDPRIRNFKTKEHAFMQPLKKIYPSIILDKQISNGCSKRRPDGLIDCLTHSIIIEIDEDQHSGYNTLCENKRTMELFNDLGSRPIIFIRLNPDKYKINKQIIKGCFINMRNGEIKLNKKEFNIRFELLIESIQLAQNIPTKEITYIMHNYSNE